MKINLSFIIRLEDDENYIGPTKPHAPFVDSSWVPQVCPYGSDFRNLMESGVSWDEDREGDALQRGRSGSCWLCCGHKARGWKSGCARHERGKMLMVVIRE